MNVQSAGISVRPQNTPGGVAHSSDPVVKTETVTAEQTSPERAKGVVRLLQEGHFKAVPDARLRAHFQNELAQASPPIASDGFDSSLHTLFNKIDNSFDTFISNIDTTQEQSASAAKLFDEFKSNISNLANTYKVGGESTIEQFTAELYTNFNTFIADLQVELAQPQAATAEPDQVPQASDTPVASPGFIAPTQPIAEPIQAPETPDTGSYFEQFRAALTEHLDNLVSSIERLVTVFPEDPVSADSTSALAKYLEISNTTAPQDSGSDQIIQEFLA